MRAVVQRVSSARVRVDGAVVGEITQGFLVLLGVGQGDGAAEVAYMTQQDPRPAPVCQTTRGR